MLEWLGRDNYRNFKSNFFGKSFSIFELCLWRKAAHNIVYLKPLFFFPMGGYLPLTFIKTIVWIFDNYIQVQPEHEPPNYLPAFQSKFKYNLNICIL